MVDMNLSDCNFMGESGNNSIINFNRVNARITNSNFEDNNGTVLSIYLSNVIIIGNNITNNNGSGILISSSSNVTIEDNSITGNLGDGVYNGGDADIVGNDIADNGGSGVINGENGTATINDNILSNNGGSGEIVNDGTASGSGNDIYYQPKLSVTTNVSSNRATVRVTAIDNRGNVIVGRTISFYVNGNFVGTAVTDSKGIAEFVYTASSIGTFNVLASLAGFNESVTFGTSIYSATNITTTFNIANIPGNGENNSTPFTPKKPKPTLDVEIKGDKIITTLIDEDGNPISGKKIVIRDRNGKIIRSGITNKNGQVIFRCPGNKVGLTVSFDGNDEFSGTDFKIKFDQSYSKNNKTSNKTTNNPAATAAMKNTGIPIIPILLVLISIIGVSLRKKQN